MNAGARYQTDVKYDQTLTDCLRCYRGRAVKSVHSFLHALFLRKDFPFKVGLLLNLGAAMLNKHLKRCFALSSLGRRDKLNRHLLPCVPYHERPS